MSVRKRAGSPYWWYSFTVHGKRYRASTEVTDKRLAEDIEAKARTDVIRGLHFGAAQDPTLTDAVVHYIKDHLGRKPRGAEVALDLAETAKEMGANRKFSQLTDDVVARFVSRRLSKLQPATINKRLAFFRAAINFEVDHYGATRPPANFRKHFLTLPAPRDRYLSVEEYDKLLAASPEWLADLIKFSVITGLRQGNVLGLDWKQVDWAAQEITFRIKSKRVGGEVHTLPIVASARVILEKYRFDAAGGAKTTGSVFMEGKNRWDVTYAWTVAIRKSGLKNFRWHDLRSTTATWMLRDGVGIDVVKEVLGHRNIETTMRYAYRTTDDKRKAMEAINLRPTLKVVAQN